MAKAFPLDFTQLAHTVYIDEAHVIAAERELLGWDHAAIVAFYLESHRIPQEVVQAVRYHHDPSNAPTHQFFAAATQLADVMARRAGLNGAAETRPVLTDRELLALPALAALWPRSGPTLTGKMRKLTELISKKAPRFKAHALPAPKTENIHAPRTEIVRSLGGAVCCTWNVLFLAISARLVLEF